MKRTEQLWTIAFLISTIAFLGFVGSVKAYTTEVDVWSEPNGYAHSYVRGSWTRIGRPYYRVHHEADIFECIKGRTHFIGWDQYNNVIYSRWEYLGFGGPLHKEYDSPYNQVWTAETETWAPLYSPLQEYASAFLLPPGML